MWAHKQDFWVSIALFNIIIIIFLKFSDRMEVVLSEQVVLNLLTFEFLSQGGAKDRSLKMSQREDRFLALQRL